MTPKPRWKYRTCGDLKADLVANRFLQLVEISLRYFEHSAELTSPRT